MAVVVSGPISLRDISNEYGGADPIYFNEYYSGAGQVPNPSPTSPQQFAGFGQSSGLIPTGGPIAMSNFYGTQKIVTLYDFYDYGENTAGNGWVFGSNVPWNN